jgi:hypothetical protein
MKIIYQDTDISDEVKIVSCVHDMYADSCIDTLCISFESPAKWDIWNPQLGDSIEIQNGSGSLTGKLYLQSLSPGETFRITAIPYNPAVVIPVSRSWERVKLSQICADIAAAYGLKSELLTSDRMYVYLSCDKSGLSYLRSLLNLERMAYVITNGKLICYSVTDAELAPAQADIVVTGERYLYTSSGGKRSGYYFSEYRPSLTAGCVVNISIPEAGSWDGPAYLYHVRHDYVKEKTKLFFRKPVEEI